MSQDNIFMVRPLAEADLNSVLKEAGGVRAYEDSDNRAAKNADYRLGNSVIELKLLNEEGLEKTDRQTNLACLFKEYNENYPVIVLDPRKLDTQGEKRFRRIIEGPIKGAISKANQQLKQTRSEIKDINCSVLMIINNGYMSLDHDSLKEMVAHRVRQDTHNIDAVVVAGAYYHSDGFDAFFLWPFECIQISIGRPFLEFENLRLAWVSFAERFMHGVMVGDFSDSLIKSPIYDIRFDVDGITYVRPAPVMGYKSEFFIRGRTRDGEGSNIKIPPMGMAFPRISMEEWGRISKLAIFPAHLFDNYEAWNSEEAFAESQSTALRPLVRISISDGDFAERLLIDKNKDIFTLACDIFNARCQELMTHSREFEAATIVPASYILAITDIIGQDAANDVSHIYLVREKLFGRPFRRELVRNARITHDQAVALAAAYALREEIKSILWSKNLEYAWW